MVLGAPDGVTRPMLLVNNQYPGPTIRIKKGDSFAVNVTNEMFSAPFSISLHLMESTSWVLLTWMVLL